MVLFNYSTKELTAKIVYYGPGLCGKTTNLQFIHGNLPGNVKGKMLSLATKTDRTLFFDFLPIDLGEIRGMKTRVQLYTVPGQVFYNETRKLVLKGADGIVFVADSQQQMLGANAESFKNLEDNLKGHAMSLAEMPHVIQFNKRDLPKLAGIEEMNSAINKYNAPFYESVATTGIGVQDTLKAITKLVLLNLTRKYDPRSAAAMASEAPAAPVPSPAAVRSPSIAPSRILQPEVPITPEPPAPVAEISSPPVVPKTPAALEAEASPGDGIPLSDVAPVSETPAFDVPADLARPASEPAENPTEFQADEIDELVGEVEQAPEPPMVPSIDRPPVDVGAESFEIDASGLDFEEPTDAGPPPPELPMEPEQPQPQIAAEVTEAEPLAGPSVDHDSFDLEHQAEPQWADEGYAIEQTLDEVGDFAPEPAGAPVAAAVESEPAPVTLTEVATDADLFEDPTVEVAHLTNEGEQEIVIPVEVADGERGLFRYRLTVKLRLDPIDS